MPLPERCRPGGCRYRRLCSTCGVPVAMLTHAFPAARCWGGGGERQRRRRWRRRRRRRSCAWPSSTWRSSASSVSPARLRCPAGRPRALSPALTHCPAAEEERAEDEEEFEPADLIGDRLKEDVVSGEAGAASRSPWRQGAPSPSRGTGTAATSAEPPPSSPVGAERPAAAPGRQRCKCPVLGCQTAGASLGDTKARPAHYSLSPCCWHPGEVRVLCWGTPEPGEGSWAAQLTSCSSCRYSLQIQPGSVCCGDTSCLLPASSSLLMTDSFFLLPRTAPSSNASVHLGLWLAVPKPIPCRDPGAL